MVTDIFALLDEPDASSYAEAIAAASLQRERHCVPGGGIERLYAFLFCSSLTDRSPPA